MSTEQSSSTMAGERRGRTRRPLVYRLDLLDADGNDIGFLVDVNAGGMKIRCHATISVSDLVEVRAQFPRWLDVGDELALSGRIAWCRPFGKHQVEAGFAFDGLSEHTLGQLAALMERLADAAIEDGRV